MFGDSDLAVFFDPTTFGEAFVQFGGSSANGILDQPMAIRLADRGFGGFNASMPSLQLPYNAFSPMPRERDTLSVNGQNYTVTEQTTEGDGAIIRFSLKVAP
jgi:hypothetical protein